MAWLKRFLNNAAERMARAANCFTHYRRHGWGQWPGSNMIAIGTGPKMPREAEPSQEDVVSALDEYQRLSVEIPKLEAEMAQVEDALNAKDDDTEE